MPKLSATWQNLLDHIQQNVVELLDFESRCALQICSKQDNYIVRRTPLTIHGFYLKHVDPNTFEISVQFEKNSARKHKKQNLEDTCATLVRMFTKKNTFFESFQIEVNIMSSSDSDKPHELWSKLLESAFQINCEQFIVVGRSSDALREQDFVVWRFLQRVNTKHLKSLRIESRISENELVKIMESEQFKTSKSIEIKMYQNYETIITTLSADNIMGAVEKLKADEAWQFIQNFDYITRCHFDLTVNKEMDITSILRRFGVLYTNPRIRFIEEILCTLTLRRSENCVDVCFDVQHFDLQLSEHFHESIRRRRLQAH